MQTIATNRAETRTISIGAPPASVLGVVGDPSSLPRWAPAFARAVRPEGEHWIVDNGETEFPILVRVAHDPGTVDLVSPADPRRGAFMRVVPNGDGSELLFTLFFGDGTADEAVDVQMATVEGELRTVRGLAEAGS